MATPASYSPNPRPPPPPTDTLATHGSIKRSGKAKKAADPANTTKQIEDTIAALERNKAGEKDQEIEIEREVRKANRELTNMLNQMQQPLSRIEAVQQRYTALLADMKRTEREHQKAKKRADQLQKEKDASRSELSKMTAVKDKLEKLCRELQKENKKLKDDNRRMTETEARMRDELHERLEGMVTDVQEFIDQKEHPESVPAHESDELFRQKFKSFIDQYELRELQFHSLLRTKDLEIQYQHTRYETQRQHSEAESHKSRQLTSQVSTFSQTETELRAQLNIYVEKFKQVEDTLNNSNDLFMTFRREMEEMSKKTKKLERDNRTLSRKHEMTSHNIIQMAEERQRGAKELDLLRKKNDNLEKLCRGMQAQGRGAATAAAAAAPNGAVQSSGAVARGGPHNHHHHHHHGPHHHALSAHGPHHTHRGDCARADGALSDAAGETAESDYDYENDELDDEDEYAESQEGDFEDEDTEDEEALMQGFEDARRAVGQETRRGSGENGGVNGEERQQGRDGRVNGLRH